MAVEDKWIDPKEYISKFITNVSLKIFIDSEEGKS